MIKIKVKDLITNKDYSLIQFRVTHPEEPEGIFFGACRSENGKLISLDGDSYNEDDEVIHYEYFNHPETNEICLDITIEGIWS